MGSPIGGLMGLLSAWNVATVTEELEFILSDFNQVCESPCDPQHWVCSSSTAVKSALVPHTKHLTAGGFSEGTRNQTFISSTETSKIQAT